MSARQLIEKLPQVFLPEIAGDANAIFQFQISEPCYLSIQNKRCTFALGQAAAPSLTLTADDEVMQKVLRGETNGMVAVMTGKMKTHGNLKLGQSMTTFFDLDVLTGASAPATKPSWLKRSLSKLRPAKSPSPAAMTTANPAAMPEDSAAGGCPFQHGQDQVAGDGFVDKLLYMVTPVDPPGDVRNPYPCLLYTSDAADE